MKSLIPAACLLALAAPSLSRADTASDLQALREEIKAMRSQYEERIRALEGRLQAAESAAVAKPLPPAPTPTPAPSTVAPGDIAARSSGTGFNPALSLILSGLYTRQMSLGAHGGHTY
jgi:type II secretory pathway pseudopilin PulG